MAMHIGIPLLRQLPILLRRHPQTARMELSLQVLLVRRATDKKPSENTGPVAEEAAR